MFFSFLLNLLSIIYKLYRRMFLYITLKMKEKMKNSSKLTVLTGTLLLFPVLKNSALISAVFLFFIQF
ncbi:hypothetical protein A9D36_16980 [Bacillus subtilis]|nr:hypothetical protein A9D36_16980 [Bacillus subtilis]